MFKLFNRTCKYKNKIKLHRLMNMCAKDSENKFEKEDQNIKFELAIKSRSIDMETEKEIEDKENREIKDK